MIHDTTSLLASWESVTRRVELRRVRGGYDVITHYAGHMISAEFEFSETRARERFERLVDKLAREEN